MNIYIRNISDDGHILSKEYNDDVTLLLKVEDGSNTYDALVTVGRLEEIVDADSQENTNPIALVKNNQRKLELAIMQKLKPGYSAPIEL